jgi:hypothetical protein
MHDMACSPIKFEESTNIERSNKTLDKLKSIYEYNVALNKC